MTQMMNDHYLNSNIFDFLHQKFGWAVVQMSLVTFSHIKSCIVPVPDFIKKIGFNNVSISNR